MICVRMRQSARNHGKIDETAAVLRTRTAASDHPPAYTGRTAMGIIRVPLTKGKYALIDEEDYPLVSPHTWRANTTAHTTYALTHIRKPEGGHTTLSMHRLIMQPEPDIFVDHIDHNGLNNTRANLRTCTKGQNGYNQRVNKLSSTGYKGVQRMSPSQRIRPTWHARIVVDGQRVRLGSFQSPEDAARAYDIAALRHFGEFAFLNFPELRDEYERQLREAS